MTLPFKTAFITDEASQDLDVAISLAEEFDLDGIELRNVWGKGPHDWSAEDIARIRASADAAGLEICAVSPPFFKCDLDDAAAVEEHLGILRRSCAAARALGVSIVRGFAFWRQGPLEENFDRIVPHLIEAARIVEQEGITLALENEFSTSNNNVRRTLQIIDAVGSPAVALLFDPGNDIHEPEGEIPWPDAYEMAKDRMVHVHLKDPKRNPETGEVVTMAIGDGDTRIPELLASLRKDGYAGYVSLETHYRRDPLPSEVARLPAGEAFSAGGYVATRECLEKWFRIMATQNS
jgi:sugar phosphate isomerase/epimerase